ncbi:hypothetical protein QWY85_16345 [Neolewinella lacunae]|uniref:Uncharacterized protein n=1 Tax=Neolewinella lacunae TaxID=1517758 RepID=A0A923PLH1_9BACT|nr:hypothetical protein [Neolewinella lacunae]MBC6993484.1 hypothetical protein [Neolewinella lacunae]MDN3636240.1 hypothetical protein [Neolewinella lacunae]
MNWHKKLLFLLFASLFAGPIGLRAQVSDEFGKFLEDHFEGGEKAFLNQVYSHIRYPRMARENCGIGHLHVRLTLKETGGLQQIDFLNPFGFGVEEDVTNLLMKTNDGWIGTGENKTAEFSISYQIGSHPKFTGDITVSAYKVGSPDEASGCPESREILEKIAKAISKENFKKVRKLAMELLRRGDKTEAFARLQEVYGADFSKMPEGDEE